MKLGILVLLVVVISKCDSQDDFDVFSLIHLSSSMTQQTGSYVKNSKFSNLSLGWQNYIGAKLVNSDYSSLDLGLMDLQDATIRRSSLRNIKSKLVSSDSQNLNMKLGILLLLVVVISKCDSQDDFDVFSLIHPISSMTQQTVTSNVTIVGRNFGRLWPKQLSRNIRGYTFIRCTFNGTRMSTDMMGTTFEKCNFTGMDFSRPRIYNAVFIDCLIANSEFSWGSMRGSKFIRTHFHTIDLSWTRFTKTMFLNSSMTNSTLSWSDFSGSYVKNSKFSNLDLSWQNFRGAKLVDSYYSIFDLGRIDLQNATILNCNYSYSNFSWENFKGQNIPFKLLQYLYQLGEIFRITYRKYYFL
ncbi:uncharacterized protein LOC100180248 [Ciona intestinalis]